MADETPTSIPVPIRNPIAVLRDVATGCRSHLYAGLCPDKVEGPDSRDPDCEVCRALNALAGSKPASATAETPDDEWDIGAEIQAHNDWAMRGLDEDPSEKVSRDD